MKANDSCLIACGIMQEEIDALISQGRIDAQVVYLNKGLHSNYQKLEKALGQVLEKHERGTGAKPVVVYGDVCLGFNNEMRSLVERHGAIKVEALNCIDCLLGGGGKLLEIDPDHFYLFLTPAFIEFTERIMSRTREETRRIFSRLKGILLIDSLGNLDDYQDRIRAISDLTGLPILETRKVGLAGLQKVLSNALKRVQP
jgi:Protein of unknown function (DUF1638)